jgi:hypothetical protein
MPTYKVTDPTSGKSLSLTGDSPPTEQELNDIFSKTSPKQSMSREEATQAINAPKPPNPMLEGITGAIKALTQPNISKDSAMKMPGIGGAAQLNPQWGSLGMFLPNIAGGTPDLKVGGISMPTSKESMGAQQMSDMSSPVGMAGAALATMPALEEALPGAMSAIKQSIGMNTPQKVSSLSREVENSLVQSKQEVMEQFGEKYGELVKDSDKTIKLTNPLNSLKENYGDSLGRISEQPNFLDALEAKNPIAKRIESIIKTVEENPNQELSLQEADKLQKWIKDLPGIKSKIAKGFKADWTDSDRILLDFANDLKGEVVEQVPELKLYNQGYGDYMKAYKGIRGDLGFNKTENTMKNFDKLSADKSLAFKKVLPSNIISKMTKFNSAHKINQLLKILGVGLGAGAATYAGGSVAGSAFRHAAR